MSKIQSRWMVSDLNDDAKQIAQGLRRGAAAPLWITLAHICVELPLLAVGFWFALYAATPVAVFTTLTPIATSAAASVICVSLLLAGGTYATVKLRQRVRSVLRAMIAFVATGLLILPLPGIASQVALATAICIAAFLMPLPLRLASTIVVRWVNDTGLIRRRAVIAGGGDNAAELIRGLSRNTESDIQVHGIFDDRDDTRSPIQVLGTPKLGGYNDLLPFVRATEVDMVIIALPLEAQERIDWLLKNLRVLPVEVRLSAYSSDFEFSHKDREPLISAISRSFAPERRLTKRVFDIALASLAVVFLSPVMAAAAIAIKLQSPGPVIFRQARHGYNDRVFQVFKFRSMYADQADPDARRIVTRGDPRVTPVGRFLRRSSIDELPQLFNVLRGDLSLVGPRPHAVEALSSQQEKFSAIVDGYSARHRLPPGITGWAQINGCRGEIDSPAKLRARIDHDLYYIENWSLWFDLAILARTPLSLLRSEGAY